ncbi:MAG: hypothetical protein U1F52_01190 [Burkholderiales bacterium]
MRQILRFDALDGQPTAIACAAIQCARERTAAVQLLSVPIPDGDHVRDALRDQVEHLFVRTQGSLGLFVTRQFLLECGGPFADALFKFIRERSQLLVGGRQRVDQIEVDRPECRTRWHLMIEAGASQDGDRNRTAMPPIVIADPVACPQRDTRSKCPGTGRSCAGHGGWRPGMDPPMPAR